jgi:hypothetical protein
MRRASASGRPGRPALPRRLLAAAGLVVTLATILGAGLGWAPAPAGAAQPSGGPTITLTDETTWLHDGDDFIATVRLAGVPAGASTQVVAHGALESRRDFEQTLAGELGSIAYSGDPVPVRPLPPAGGDVTVTIPAGAGLRQGVHPVEVRVLDQAGEVVASLVTYTTQLRDTDGLLPLAVSVVVDIASPPALQPDGSVVMSSATLDRIDERVTVLEDAPKVPLTVAPRPETVDALPQAGARGFALLDRLNRATDAMAVLARPFTDIDVAAFGEADMVSEVNAQADAGAQVIRDRFDGEPIPGVWLVSGTVGDPAARLLNQVGVAHAIVDRAAVADAPGLTEAQVPEEPVRLGDAGPEAMVSDDVLATRLTGHEGVLDAQRFVAELATVWLKSPGVGRGVVVRIPADAPLDPEVVVRALKDIGDPAGREALAPVSAADVFGRVPPTDGDARPTASPAPHAVTSDLTPLKGRLEGARASVPGIGGVLEDPDLTRSLQHSLLLATGSTTPDDQRNAYIGRVTTQLSDVEGLVDLPNEFRITLTSRSGSIPLNLTNTSDRQIAIRIDLQSDQLEFPDGDVVYETLPPGATRLDVRVRVLASGAFPLDITITTPDGSVEIEEARYDIRSTAVSGVGVVLSVGAILFLAIWWLRNWRATTRSKRLVSAEEAAALADAHAAHHHHHHAGADAATGDTAASPPPWAPLPPEAGGPTGNGDDRGVGATAGAGEAPDGPPAHGPTRDPGAPAHGGGSGGDDPADDYRPAHLSSPRRPR